MTLPIKPLETIAAEGITGLFIAAGAKGIAATIVKRATATLAIVTAVTQVATGTTVQGLNAISTALSSTDLDPGEALALQGVITTIANQAALMNSVLGGSLLGVVGQAVYANISAGIIATCNAEIAKYGSAAPAPAAAA